MQTRVGDKWGEVGRELGVGAKHSQCSENEGRGGAAGGGGLQNLGGSFILELEERRGDWGRILREATCAWRAAEVLQCLTTATTEC